MHAKPAQPRIRVIVQQPCLTRYRIPVFRALAAREGIDLTVAYGEEAGITNAEPDGFNGIFVPLHDYELGRTLVRWHAAQPRFATREHADVVVLSWSTRYVTLLPALIRARWNNVGTVLWGHGYSKSESGVRENARMQLGRLADCMLFYNTTTAQELVNRRFIANEQSFIALNSLDQDPIQTQRDLYKRSPDLLDAFRREHDLVGKRVVLFVSRLYESNRVELLLRATAQLRPHIPGLVTAIVGTGPDLDRLKSVAEQLGIADAVRFPGAIYEESKIAPWFLASDLFCYPNNIGLSILHAMGYALPVVTSDATDAQNPEIEALVPGENGDIYSDGNVDSLTEKIRGVLIDPALRKRMSDHALATATTGFSLNRMVDGFESAIRYANARRQRSA